MHPDDLRQQAQEQGLDSEAIGNAVAYFRGILEQVDVVEDVVEWKETA